jgi:polar amino acid transport system permease protein
MADAQGRRPSRVPDHLAMSIGACILMLLVGVFALISPVPNLRWIALVSPTGLYAPWVSLRVRRLASSGDVAKARQMSQRALDVAWLVIGAALTIHVIGFMSTFLLVRGDASKTTGKRPSTVGETYFRWSVLSDREAWSSIFAGFRTNVSLAIVSQLFILVWSLFIAVLRMLPGKWTAPVRWLVTLYGDLFRSLPGILVILIVGLGLKKAGLPIVKDFSTYQYACIALVIVYGAYVSEVFRAGLESVHPSQIAGARSLGLSYGQTLRFVAVPQAVRRVIPPLLNDFIALQKDTAILGFVGVLEGVGKARFYNNAKGTLVGYTIIALMFVVITIPQARFVDYLLKRQQNKQFGRSRSKQKPADIIRAMQDSTGARA